MPAVTSEKIVWIAVPWAVGQGDKTASVSVLVSPRLDGDPSASAWSLGPVNAAPDAQPHCSFIDWPSILQTISFAVRIGDPANPAGATRFDFAAPSADGVLWSRLFGGHTPVTSFHETLVNMTSASSEMVVRSYSPRTVTDLVRDAYVAAVTGEPQQPRAMNLFAAQSVDGALQDFLDFHEPSRSAATNAVQSLAAGDVSTGGCEVHTLAADDRGRLIVVGSESSASPCFVLPSRASVSNFAVTFRNERATAFTVKTADGTPIIVDDPDGTSTEVMSVVVPQRTSDDDDDVVFRAVERRWQIEHVRGLDFHEAVSALSPYPQLMKKLGLLLEFELPFRLGDAVAGSGFISVAPVDHPQSCAIESRSMSPWTAFSTHRVGARYVFSARPENLIIEAGLLRNETSRHHVMQLDVDGAAFQMRSHATTAAADAQAGGVAREIAPSAPTEAPAFRHGGFALIDEEMETEVRRAMERRTRHEQTFQGGALPVLFADDLVQGYRIDTSCNGDPWRSLCKRHGSYAAGLDEIEIEGISDDEGHVSLVGDQKQDGEIRISRAVFRWDGWSLAVARPMKAINDGGHVVENTKRRPHATFPLKVEFTPVAGTLQRLRFGSDYTFRARAVDVAGNALLLEDADAITGVLQDRVVFREADGSFDRFEPIDAPIVTPLQPPGRNETADVLVIRQDDRGHIETREWLILPPKVSQLLAEKHGVLDPLKKPIPVWKAIVARDGDLPGGTSGDYDPAWLDRHSRGAVPYFADPLARGASLQPLPNTTSAVRMPFFARDALQARPFRLSLRGRGSGVAARGRDLSIVIPQGRAFEVALSSYTHEDTPALFPTWRWVAQRQSLDAGKGSELATTGQLPGVTPPRKLKLIHAVQKPLVPDGGIRFFTLVPQPRKEGDVTVRLDGELAIDVPSTGRVDMHAEWTEQIDNPAVPSFIIEPHAAELFPRNVGPNGEAESAECTPPAPANGGFPICGTQTFTNTHHRKVRYRAHAVSRFVEFYPGELTKDRANVSRPSADVEVHVLNTALPAVPEVAYVVPAFEWSEEKADRHTLRTTRTSVFRVYLKRGWFSSGDDEMAAIVLAPDSGDMTILGELVTEWGVDPIWKSESLTRRPRLSDFPAVTVSGASEAPCNSELRRSNVMATLRREKKEDGSIEEVIQPVDVAAYPVALDAEKNLLYFDVAIDTHGTYFPFVRLALARYQSCSIEGKFLSPIARTTFTQVTPQRTITLNRARYSDDYEVVVAGPSYEPHAANEPLSIGKRATIEITLERKESGMGKSDMDWFPIIQPIPLTPSGNAKETVWRGQIKTRWLQRDAYHRIVVKEYEHFYADPIAPSDKPSETRRLVFAHAVRFNEV